MKLGNDVRRPDGTVPTGSLAKAARRLAMGFLLVSIIGGPLVADVFRLKDGRRLEGTVVREIGDMVSIKTDDGIVTIDKHDIVSQRESKTPFDTYRSRLEALADDDLPGHLDLAHFCEQNGLADEAVRLYKRIIELDADHEETREKLGYVWFAGEWFIAGSAELERKRQEIADIDVSGASELTAAEVEAAKPRPEVKLPPLPSSAPRLALKLDERIGKEKPERSGADYTIASLCRQLQPALSASTAHDPREAPFVVEVKIRTSFLKEVQFYNMPLTNMYRCSMDIGIGERNADGSLRRVGTLRFDKDFTLTTRVDKEKGLQNAYHAGIAELNRRLRTMPFFQKRGAKPLPEPASR